VVPREISVWVLRILLILWLGFAQKADDDLFGVLTSIRRFDECKRIVHLTAP
jgi:hypothetical protein